MRILATALFCVLCAACGVLAAPQSPVEVVDQLQTACALTDLVKVDEVLVKACDEIQRYDLVEAK